MHGNEWEGGESCLYLAEYLLINFDNNETITHILNSSEVYLIPLVNPDSRQDDSRFDDNGIDLARNFDIDFGRIRGWVIPLGKLFGRIKIPYLPFNLFRGFKFLHKLFPSFPLWVTNCGRRPFSEPETQAIRDFMRELENDDFSFYLDCHTGCHNFVIPWDAFKPPFEIPKQEQMIYNYAKEWVAKNTEYENADISYQGVSYKASGSPKDWCFKEFRIPSFTFEILSHDYDPGPGKGKHDNLVHWMETTLPVFMYLLVNIDNLRQWRTPDVQPSLPEGVPPEPLK
jgi:predicted deacylase